MKCDQHVKDIYKIAGMLEILTCMEGRRLTAGMVAELVDAVDKLELIGADLLSAEHEIKIEYTLPDKMIDFFGEDDPETEVSAHEGSEESPPEGQPADQ
jgi:hypothetical protein